MDQDTRNKLQRATQQVRRILEEEFTEQLEGTFDVLPNGKILPEPGKHLDARQRLTRQKLVDAIAHIKASGKKPQEAVDEYSREAAFTFLNRFVALRMLEARGMLQECVSKGDASSGFKEFCGLAPGLSSLDDGGYRLYLECLFDELTVEVKVLFDRRDSVSLLWPRRGALTEVLDTLGQADLAGAWSEDETIGWVYQYFNSGDERKKMREESPAPRNSRELAVRNQFFTPRYVVEFLTDNTLGRIWYEMREGDTRLVDECEYLVRRSSEVFLSEGQEPPAEEGEAAQDLSQEELLKKTVYIPRRPKKDPRDLKILDPACGSGHFLLYAFDLLISIYEEAWVDEASPKSQITGRQLRDDYADLEQLHAALPGLVLAHNLHGIDIDPRAAQIAALALWMRVQRAFNDSLIAREQRPVIARSNIVCAEPMPGEAAFLDEFIAEQLEDDAEGRFLANLVTKVFEAMKLAGEAGSLLRIEEDIAKEVSIAKKRWLDRPEYKQQTLFADGSETMQKELDLTRGITDESFWEEAEQRIYDALHAFSEQTERSGLYQRRLFANDTTRGFAFIDLCRQRYDAVVMNPPFGDLPIQGKAYLEKRFPLSKSDVCGMFILRGLELSAERGFNAAITNRTPFFLAGHSKWRNELLDEYSVCQFTDLGDKVLDALVETSAYVIQNGTERSHEAEFFRLVKRPDKEAALAEAICQLKNGVRHDLSYLLKPKQLQELPASRFSFWLPPTIRNAFRTSETLHDLDVSVDVGISSKDDFRFVRTIWEISPDAITLTKASARSERPWMPLAKGGEYSTFHGDIHLVAKWANEGAEIAELVVARYPYLKGNADWVLHPESHYTLPGITYSKRTTSAFGPRLLPRGCLFNDQGIGVFTTRAEDRYTLLGLLLSRCTAYLLELSMASADAVSSGSAARHYETGVLGSLLSPVQLSEYPAEIADGVSRISNRLLDTSSTDEPSMYFISPFNRGVLSTAKDTFLRERDDVLSAAVDAIETSCAVERVIRDLFQFGDAENEEINSEVGLHPGEHPRRMSFDNAELDRLYKIDEKDLIEIVATELGASRSISKKAFIANRRLELICAYLDTHPSSIVSSMIASASFRSDELVDFVERSLSYLFGASLGRWDVRTVSKRPVDLGISSETAALCCPPGMLRNPEGFPAVPADVPRDYPLRISWPGILVDDEGHPEDVVARVHEAVTLIWGELAPVIEQEACEILRVRTLREYFRGAKGFFSGHIKRYSKSRRKAPIYWQLATPSDSYSVWMYFHRFTRYTFFQVLNEYVKPKLSHERLKLERNKGEASAEPTRSQRKEIEDQEKFVAELAAMVEEVERIVPLWNPNLNDGVIINFAPLWRLVPQNKSWQKECKKVWDKLVKGEYDWAHLAMHLWPERVVPKCATDASLAIAHGLEEVFWEQDDRDRFQPKEEPAGGWEPIIKELVDERTSPAVKAALESLLTAPAPAGNSKSRRRKATT